jgi:hypothetical protein
VSLAAAVQDSASPLVLNPHGGYPGPIGAGNTRESSSALFSSAAPRAVFTLQQDWKAGHVCLKDHIQSVGKENSLTLFIGSSATGIKSIFDLIVQTVPRDEQVLFTKALLLAYFKLAPQAFIHYATSSFGDFYSCNRAGTCSKAPLAW